MENYNRIEKHEWGICYYLGDKLHRTNGPACEYADGNKTWWIEGKEIECSSQEEFERYLKLKLFW